MSGATKVVGHNKENRRIWFEGADLAAAGFKPGRRYSVTITANRITILAGKGNRKVVGKDGVPIIDLSNSDITKFVDRRKTVKVSFSEGKIVISK